MNVTLRQLRTFLVGTKSVSFSEAAGRANLSQPGFSLLIRQLETELGVKLFHRTTRRVELTQSGRELGARLEQVLEELDRALHEAGLDEARQHGHVNIGVMPSIGASIAGEVIAYMRAAHPGISLTIIDDQAIPLAHMVADNLIDFAISVAVPPEQDLTFSPLIRDRMVFVLHPTEPILREGKPEWREVFTLPYIAFAQSSVQECVARALQTAGMTIEPVAEVKFIATATGMVRAGVGFAILPELALGMARVSDLVVLPISPAVTRKVGIVANNRRSLSPAAVVAREAVCRVVKAFERRRMCAPSTGETNLE